jgi:hypothetical protein
VDTIGKARADHGLKLLSKINFLSCAESIMQAMLNRGDASDG